MDRDRPVGLGQDQRRSRTVLHLVVIATILIIENVYFTQNIAAFFGYSPLLGSPLTGHYYAPWNWIGWTLNWYRQYPVQFYHIFLYGGVIGAIAFGVYAALWAIFKNTDPSRSLHGSAHFADPREIEATGLLDGSNLAESVIVGGIEHKGRIKPLLHDGPEHVFVQAPTRSGKGVSLVIPTLLSWRKSCVVLDIKGENFARTAGWRQSIGNRIFRFDPHSVGNTARFNPLAELSAGSPYIVSDAQNIATMIVDPDGRGLHDHWVKTAYDLLTGVILHVVHEQHAAGKVAALPDVVTFLSDPERPFRLALEEMLKNTHADPSVSAAVAQIGRASLNKADPELSGVVSTALSFLALYRDPVVAENVSQSDFRIADLMADEPATLYIITPPSDKDRLRPLLRLLLNQILRTLTRDFAVGDGSSRSATNQRLLMMIDEFPSLGRLDIFRESLAYMAGYGIKAYLIAQDIKQLYEAYGRDEAITPNCHIHIAFAPNSVTTAQMLSDMAGKSTVVHKVQRRSGSRTALALGRVDEHEQETQRPLMTPDEIRRLPGPKKDHAGRIIAPGDMLIFVAGHPVIRGRQFLYFANPVLSKRATMAAQKGTARPEHDLNVSMRLS